MPDHLKRGDQFVWRHDDEPEKPVYIEVTRVARDGSWADIRCCTWAVAWTKRQPLPLPEGCRPRRWTRGDLDRDFAAAWEAARRALDGDGQPQPRTEDGKAAD